jgi:3-phenylpropionate/trans-cinnamate dioxygenase ferredoxin reductase subunit
VPTEPRTFAVVGAGQAGAWVARTLRAEGFAGRIVLIGAEAHWPYERPPLSKAVLAGVAEPAAAVLLTPDQSGELGIEAWLADPATAIDRAARTLSTASGRTLGYDRLFLTTGAVPREPAFLAGAASRRIHRLRTADDAGRLRERLRRGRRLVVLGGGWIGLEVAATARELGLDVALVEAAPRLCARSAPAAVSDYLLAVHRGRGVAVGVGAACTGVHLAADEVALELSGGERVEGDDLVFGIGVTPDVGLAQACGLAVDDGILVDETGRTSDPAIYAAGDATRRRSAVTGCDLRLECWQNAQNQAIAAARAALGQAAIHDEIPWAWSDQYGRNFQLLGAPERAATVSLRGDPAAGAACWLACDATGRAIGAVAVDAPRELRAVRKALQQGRSPDPAAWADLGMPPDCVPLV